MNKVWDLTQKIVLLVIDFHPLLRANLQNLIKSALLSDVIDRSLCV